MSENEFPLFQDRNVKYNGSPSSNLDIAQGETVYQVLDKLVIGLSALIDKVNSCSFCQGDGETITLEASSIATTATMQNSTITSSGNASFKTIPNATGVGVSVNLDDVVSGLGDNVTVLKTRTTIEGLKNGFPSNIVNTNKSNISINLKPENFPANVETEIRYQDSQGEKTLKLRVPVSPTSSDISLPMQGINIGVPNVSNQEDLNQTLQERLLNAENSIAALNSINVSGFNNNLPTGSNIGQAISYVLAEIESIKAQLP